MLCWQGRPHVPSIASILIYLHSAGPIQIHKTSMGKAWSCAQPDSQRSTALPGLSGDTGGATRLGARSRWQAVQAAEVGWTTPDTRDKLR